MRSRKIVVCSLSPPINLMCFSIIQITMKVAFLFPSTPAVRFTAAKLLETGYEVIFYCPEKIDLELTENMIFECNIIGKDQSIIRNTDNPFSVQDHKDLSDCDFIG